MTLAVDRRLALLAMMIWAMPEHASIGDLKRKILASDALAGRSLPTEPQNAALSPAQLDEAA